MNDLTKSPKKNQDYGAAFNKWPARLVWVVGFAALIFAEHIWRPESIDVAKAFVLVTIALALTILKQGGEIVELRGRCNDLQDAIIELQRKSA